VEAGTAGEGWGGSDAVAGVMGAGMGAGDGEAGE